MTHQTNDLIKGFSFPSILLLQETDKNVAVIKSKFLFRCHDAIRKFSECPALAPPPSASTWTPSTRWRTPSSWPKNLVQASPNSSHSSFLPGFKRRRLQSKIERERLLIVLQDPTKIRGLLHLPHFQPFSVSLYYFVSAGGTSQGHARQSKAGKSVCHNVTFGSFCFPPRSHFQTYFLLIVFAWERPRAHSWVRVHRAAVVTSSNVESRGLCGERIFKD